MIVDPWGKVLAQVPDRPGFATARLDLDYLGTFAKCSPWRSTECLSG